MKMLLTTMKRFCRHNPVIAAVTFSCSVAWFITLVTVVWWQTYGLGTFILLPMLIGFSSSAIYRRCKPAAHKSLSRLAGLLALIFYCAGLLGFAMEGLLCILMAAPLGGMLTFIGSLLSEATFRYKQANQNILLLLLFLTPVFSAFESAGDDVPDTFSVHTSVVINASQEKVWQHVVTFSPLPAPQEWLFRSGIAYPTHATIVGTGVGAVRYCHFSTGSFVEPITIWNEPSLLAFSVRETPMPMKELSPWGDIDPAHLHGYFVSEKGQFHLTALSPTQTLLEGTTWYHHNIKPSFYWKLWSGWIIHRIHVRVMTHIKAEAEKD